ncbi:MAG: 50S ribosomal protein L11 methyltransferase [Candidatus Puniceispirillum sp.]|nr:50S ribosomal protein L11 methyltransferase [Candidatus Puniceispirillum sp.]
MTALQSAALLLPARLDDKVMAAFELVFSELLDSVATSHQRDDNGDWQIEALFEYAPDAAVIDKMLAPLYRQQGITPMPITLVPVAARDWLAENRAAFPPLHIGRFWIYGSHVTRPQPPASLPLLIDAALAFGSGTHPTTEGCLRALQMIRSIAPRRVLDMGCGSAILAMAGARLWPSCQIVAADNDPVAVRVAARNRALNAIAPAKMLLAVSHGFGSRIVCNQAPYDLVLANILAGPLCRMAPDLVPRLANNSWLILSGILRRQARSVEIAYRAQKMRLWHRICLGDWTTIIMRPAAASTMPRLWRGGV